MDFYGEGSVTDLSVNDVFENEVQSEVNEILRSDSARFSPQPSSVELSSLQTTGLDLDSTEFTILPNYFQEQAVQTTAQDANPTSVLTTTANTVDLSQITGMDGVENSIHSLLVDPQTGMPVSTTALQLDPNSAQASLQMIVNSLPELQAQISASGSASSTETLGLSNIGNIITQAPILSLNTQQQPQSPLILSTGSQSGNQNLTFQNGTLQATDLSQINLSNFNELAAQTLISQLQQQQLHLANGNVQNASVSDLNSALKIQQQKGNVHPASPKAKVDKVYPKPAYSYSCLITMALKNSQTGCLPVSEIYQFMCENFPYFKTAPDGWKNSVRHNLSLNKCFAKIEKPQVNNSNGSARKGCLWAMNPEKQAKMEEEVYKWTQKDPSGIKRSMAKPEEFSRIEALSRITSSPKSSPRESTPPVAKVPPPLQSIISTATTTTVTPSETKHEVTHNNIFAEQFFNPSLNLLDPTLTQLDGDLGLQDNLLDTFNDISSLDVPMTTSPFTAFSFSGPILDSSPLKDTTHTVSSAFLLDSPQTHTASSLQFCSPTRAPQVTAFM